MILLSSGRDWEAISLKKGVMPLSYGDVRTVLALIDGHTQGTAHFVDGDLSVTVRARQPGPDTGAGPVAGAARVVRSPAVGRLRIPAPTATEAIALGGRVEADTVLATVLAPGRDTPVKAEVGGILEALCAEDGDFVEYGQALAMISGGEAS